MHEGRVGEEGEQRGDILTKVCFVLRIPLTIFKNSSEELELFLKWHLAVTLLL